jgi:hypothetical protein
MFLADQLAGFVKHLAATSVAYRIRSSDLDVEPNRPHISSDQVFRRLGLVLGETPMLGALAQLGEHLLCKQGVIGSIPIRSTKHADLQCKSAGSVAQVVRAHA